MKSILISILALSMVNAQAQLIGFEPFDYKSAIVDADGGSFWDSKNTSPAGHTNQASDWDLAPGLSGVSTCSGGKLFTNDSGVIREYAGTDTTGEGAGAVNDSTVAKKVYYSINMTRGSNVTWCGLSSFDFGSERLFFGLYPGATNFGIYNQTSFTALNVSTVPVVVGQAYHLVVKIDYAADVVALYVNPDVNIAETSNTPVATAPFTSGQWSTALRIASGGASGLAVWDELTVATTWESLRTYPVYRYNGDGVSSLPDAMEKAGISGGRVTFPNSGAMYATTGTRLIRFHRNTPGVLTLDVPITGLQPSEVIVGMDFRDDDSGFNLFAMGITYLPGGALHAGRLYRINALTGAATLIGSGPFSTTLQTAHDVYGFDFFPFPSDLPRIRITNSGGLHITLRSDFATLSGPATPTPITTPNLNSLAYDDSDQSTNLRTLYALSSNVTGSALYRIGALRGDPLADDGVATLIGPLNPAVRVDRASGFDISNDGKAWFTSTKELLGRNQSFLYSIDLQTAAVTEIAQIGSDIGRLSGFAATGSKIQSRGLSSGPRDTIIDGGSHDGAIRIGFSDTLTLLMGTGQSLALRKLTIEDSEGIEQGANSVLSAHGCTFHNCNGSAIRNSAGLLKLDRCTFTENTAGQGAALRLLAGSVSKISHCTFTGNHSTNGGGAIENFAGNMTLTGCIVAGNTSGNNRGPDLWDSSTGALPITAVQDSVIGNHKDYLVITATVANRNAVGTPAAPVLAHLAPLGEYGGTTRTMPPLYQSTAIDRARTTHFSGDQRGFLINNFPDSGAAEFQGRSDLARYWDEDWDHDGSPYGVEQAVGTDPFTPDASSPDNLRIRLEGGEPVLTFREATAARPYTRWVVKRSFDLQSFPERLYFFDASPSSGVALGILQDTEAGRTRLRDLLPNPPRAFYRLEAELR